MATNPITSESLTVDFRSLMKIPVGDRAKAASISPDFLQSILNALTPIQIANAFPNYYKRQLPDVSNFVTSYITSRNGGNFNQTGGGNDGSAYPYYDGEDKPTGKRPRGAPEPTIEEMKKKLIEQGIDVEGAYSALSSGAILEGDERFGYLQNMSDEELKTAGMQRIQDEYGKTLIKLLPNETASLSDEEIIKRADSRRLDPTKFMDPATSGKLRPEIIERYRDKKFPVTIRNNNMGAMSLKDDSNKFVTEMPGYLDKTPRPANEGGYYARYATPEHGVAAASRNLENYGKKGITRPSDIVKTWARDGNQNYINTVVKYLNDAGYKVDQNTDLDLSDPKVRVAILKGKSAFESGAGVPVYTDDVYNTGATYQFENPRDTTKPYTKEEIEVLRQKEDEYQLTQRQESLIRQQYNKASPTSSEFIQSPYDDRNQTIINEYGYSAPVTGTMMHEGHGRTSEFGYGRGRLHAGVDIYSTDPETGQLRVGSNAPVTAPMDAKVTMIMKDRGRAGNYIEIQDKNGNRHRFLHTDKNPALNPTTGEPWKVGESVTQGQTITNITGSGTKFDQKVQELGGDINAAVSYFDQNGWGSVNKPHLHYEVRDSRGKLLDPSTIFPEYSGENKENITFSNRNDKLKHLLVTGQITKDDYDKQMQNDPEVLVKKENTNDTNLEDTSKNRKPLSIIEYSRPTEDVETVPATTAAAETPPVVIESKETIVAETPPVVIESPVPAEPKETTVAEAPAVPAEPKETTAATLTPPPDEVRKYALGGNIYEPNEDMTLVDTDTGNPIAQIGQDEKIEKTGNAIQVTPETKLKADELTSKYDSSIEMEDRMSNIEDNMQSQQTPDTTNQIVQKAREPEKVQTETPYRWRESVASAERAISPSFNRAMARSKFFGEGHHFTRSAPSSQS